MLSCAAKTDNATAANIAAHKQPQAGRGCLLTEMVKNGFSSGLL